MKYLVALLLPALAGAATIWPDGLGSYYKTPAAPPALTDKALWSEYGLQQTESAQYDAGTNRFTATAYRFSDPTGALGAYEWRRPADAKPSKLARMAVEDGGDLILLTGNYLLEFHGYKPTDAELAALAGALPNRDGTPLPSLLDFFPAEGLVANSERYILGPSALERFEPRIPPSTAAFHMGAEAQLGSFRSAGGNMQLVLFNYPTPQIAIAQAPEFQKIPGAMVKRSGPLIAVVIAPPNRDDAERLLARVRYQASVTMSEYVPTRRDNIGNLIINVFILIGLLLGFSLVAGIALGGVRVIRKRFRKGREPEPMIILHLEGR